MSTTEQVPDAEGAPQPDDVPTDGRHDAFISYSHRDVAFARRLRDALGARGKTAWLDESGIRPAERWEGALTRAIEGADVIVFVISPDSVGSTECGSELAHAARNGKRIIPVLHRPIDMATAPAELGQFQFIPSRGRFEEDFDRCLELVLSAIDTDLDWLQEHTHWGLKAIEWERGHRDASLLLSGSELEAAEAWLSHQSGKRPEPTSLQNEFVLLSRRHTITRLRRTRAWTSAALVVVSALAVVALVLRGQAVANQHIAQSRQLAAEGVAALGSDPELSALLSVRALGVQTTARPRAHCAAPRRRSACSSRSSPAGR